MILLRYKMRKLRSFAEKLRYKMTLRRYKMEKLRSSR